MLTLNVLFVFAYFLSVNLTFYREAQRKEVITRSDANFYASWGLFSTLCAVYPAILFAQKAIPIGVVIFSFVSSMASAWFVFYICHRIYEARKIRVIEEHHRIKIRLKK